MEVAQLERPGDEGVEVSHQNPDIRRVIVDAVRHDAMMPNAAATEPPSAAGRYRSRRRCTYRTHPWRRVACTRLRSGRPPCLTVTSRGRCRPTVAESDGNRPVPTVPAPGQAQLGPDWVTFGATGTDSELGFNSGGADGGDGDAVGAGFAVQGAREADLGELRGGADGFIGHSSQPGDGDGAGRGCSPAR